MATDDQTPRRRHSPAVYRRRRLVVFLGLLVVVALVVWLLVAQPWSGTAAESSAPSQTPATSSEPAATDLPVPGGETAEATETRVPTTPQEGATTTAKPCNTGDVTVEGVTDAETYAPGQNPQFSIRLTNRSAVDCTLNVGTSTQSFTVKSGDDTWWRSTDCQTEPSDMIVLLAAGQSVASAAPLTWDRTRSSVDSCGSSDRPVAGGGGATYLLSVSIGGVDSMQATQFFLS